MILFKLFHVEPILSGRKIQTRRLWAKARVKVGSVHWAQTSFRSSSRFARVEVTGLRRERLGDILQADAEREGYSTVAEYFAVFKAIYRRFDVDEPVWVGAFRVIQDEGGQHG